MLKKLYVELSTLCNFNCEMCFRNQWFDESTGLMADEIIESVKESIREGAFETVFFGGMGEPLMHPRLTELVAFANENGKRTELITNASLITKELSSVLEKSGLDVLWVSMDGFSSESYEKIRRGGAFREISEHLSEWNAVREHTKLGIAFVVMKDNEKELDRINAFADSVRADMIHLSHVLPGEAVREADTLYDRTYAVGRMRRFHKEAVPRELDHCPFIEEGAAFVRFDGGVYPCMQLLHNSYTYLFTERRKVFSFAFGDLRRNSLKEIWESAAYADFRKRVRDFEFPCCTVCLGCEDRLENRKDCMYNESPTCGACLWAQGLIRCP